jgi:hypothetical protein
LFLFGYSFFIKNKNILEASMKYMLLICLLVVSGANPLWLLPFVILVRPRMWKLWIIFLAIQSLIEIPLIQLNSQQHAYYHILAPLSLSLGMALYSVEFYMLRSISNKTLVRKTTHKWHNFVL